MIFVHWEYCNNPNTNAALMPAKHNTPNVIIEYKATN